MITVVGVFDKFGPAQSAKNELLVAGFTWRQVQLNPDHEIEVKDRERPASRQAGDQSVRTTMGNLVRGLFGVGSNRSAHGDLYGSSVRHGDYVLIADVDSEQARARAEEIMRRFGPVELTHQKT
jgi:hypothetical protein